jgi:hypothetical protein
MSETIGDLLDKLSISNIKIFTLQDQLYAYAKMEPADFEGVDPLEVHSFLNKLAHSNLTRTSLIGEIDAAIGKAIRTGKAPEQPRVKLT